MLRSVTRLTTSLSLWWRDVRYGARNELERDRLARTLPSAVEASIVESLSPRPGAPRNVLEEHELNKASMPSLRQRVLRFLSVAEVNGNKTEVEGNYQREVNTTKEFWEKRKKAAEARYEAKVAVAEARYRARMDELAAKKAPVIKKFLDGLPPRTDWTPPAQVKVPVIEVGENDPILRLKKYAEYINHKPFPFPDPEKPETLQASLFPRSSPEEEKEISNEDMFARERAVFQDYIRKRGLPRYNRMREIEARGLEKLAMMSEALDQERRDFKEKLRLRRRRAREDTPEEIEIEREMAAEQAAEEQKAAEEKGEEGAAESIAASSGQMTLLDAVNILGLVKKPTREELIEKREAMKALNDPEKGGSAFLRDKIQTAADVVLSAIDRNAPFPSMADAEKPAEKTPKKPAK